MAAGGIPRLRRIRNGPPEAFCTTGAKGYGQSSAGPVCTLVACQSAASRHKMVPP